MEKLGQVGEEKLLTVKGVSEYLQLCTQTVYLKLKRGEIEHSRVGGKILVKLSILENLVDRGTVPGKTA